MGQAFRPQLFQPQAPRAHGLGDGPGQPHLDEAVLGIDDHRRDAILLEQRGNIFDFGGRWAILSNVSRAGLLRQGDVGPPVGQQHHQGHDVPVLHLLRLNHL